MSVAELGQVLNVDRALFEAMQPMATVYSWVPQIDPLAADAEVLAALPGVDSETVQRVLAMREEGADNSEIVTALKSVRRYLARRRSATYTLLAEARADGGVTAIRRAVVKLSRRGKKPVAVLAWYHDAGGRLPEVSAVADVSREDEPDS